MKNPMTTILTTRISIYRMKKQKMTTRPRTRSKMKTRSPMNRKMRTNFLMKPEMKTEKSSFLIKNLCAQVFQSAPTEMETRSYARKKAKNFTVRMLSILQEKVVSHAATLRSLNLKAMKRLITVLRTMLPVLRGSLRERAFLMLRKIRHVPVFPMVTLSGGSRLRKNF